MPDKSPQPMLGTCNKWKVLHEKGDHLTCSDWEPLLPSSGPATTLTFEGVLKELELRGIVYAPDLLDDGEPWEVMAEPEPQYFATLRDALDFWLSLRDNPDTLAEPPFPTDRNQTCRCDVPYRGAHPVGTPDNCERCGLLIATAAPEHTKPPHTLYYGPEPDDILQVEYSLCMNDPDEPTAQQQRATHCECIHCHSKRGWA